jgi:transcriptional regulator with XRE-family HTH domain
VCLGINIRKIRIILGIPQEAVANELLVQVMAVQRMECSKRISKQVLFRLVRFYNLKIGDSIITIDDVTSFSEQKFIQKIKSEAASSKSLNIYNSVYDDLFAKILKLAPNNKQENIKDFRESSI